MLIEKLTVALAADDVHRVKTLLERAPDLLIRKGAFGSPPILGVRSGAMLDALLEAGADMNARSEWWAGGFGLLDLADIEVARYAVERGAVVDAHAAARLGLAETLQKLLEQDPALVSARGGDGKTPLHCAQSIEVADLLLACGADIDARDVDHESTPVQHMVKDHPLVARHLVELGCETDLLLAAALGDTALAARHLDGSPDCVRLRVSEDFFPKSDPRGGGTIYQWTLGFYVGALRVARLFGQQQMLKFLLERSPSELRLLDACECGDREEARALLHEQPHLVDRLTSPELRQVAHAARNNETEAVSSMLECGWPVDTRGQHNAAPLHWAAWHGNLQMVQSILLYGPPLEATDADFSSTPLGWARHGSEHSWHRSKGSYPEVIATILEAGARSI